MKSKVQQFIKVSQSETYSEQFERAKSHFGSNSFHILSVKPKKIVVKQSD